VVSAESHRTAPGGEAKATQGPSSLHGCKRKAELESSGDSIEPVNRSPAHGAGSAHLPANSTLRVN